MESQPQNPECGNNPENFHPWNYGPSYYDHQQEGWKISSCINGFIAFQY